MHPTITSYVVKAHAQDIEAEAAKIQLAKSVQQQQPVTENTSHWGLRLRRSVPLFRGKSASAAAA